jgi:hypothetical protein
MITRILAFPKGLVKGTDIGSSGIEEKKGTFS